MVEHEAEHVPGLLHVSVVQESPSLQSKFEEHIGVTHSPKQQIFPEVHLQSLGQEEQVSSDSQLPFPQHGAICVFEHDA